MSPLNEIQEIKKPRDLAQYVYDRLQTNTIDHDINNLETLIELFECLFYASLHSEEGDLIRVAITFFDAENPQLKIHKFEPTDKWRYISFEKPLPLNVNTLVKLSKAADPWSSSLAVFYDENSKLFIYGMIDQAIHSQSYINFEVDKKPGQPGYFRASIIGTGNISVTTEYDLIATLKQECLITEYLNVFQSGPIGELIKKLARSLNKDIINYLNDNFPDEDHTNWDYSKAVVCRTTIARIINQIRKYNHGGAILFTNETKNLDIKYPLKYDRIVTAMSNLMNSRIAISVEEDDDTDFTKMISLEQHYLMGGLHDKKRSATNELKGAIRFVASQSCVDGLVLIDYGFIVQGFGVVIKTEDYPATIYESTTARVVDKKLIPHQTDKFGTRHRSMFAYCYNHPGSMGFVISQDGDIRAVNRIDDKLIMWENIQTQKTIKSAFFKREKKKAK